MPSLLARVVVVLLLVYPALVRAADEGPSTDLAALVGQTVTIDLKGGKSLRDVEVTKVAAGAEPGTAKTLSIKVPPQGRQQVVAANTIVEIFSGATPWDVSFDVKTKVLAHDPERRAKRLANELRVAEQLRSSRARLWTPYTPAEQAQFVAEQKEYLDKIERSYSGLNMKLHETQYYLLLTDMPAAQIGIYLAHLDSMYTQLSKAFGIREGENIFRGKCPVIAFIKREDFRDCETRHLENPNSAGAQGICHSFGDGRVVVTCYRGDDPDFFAHVLVHETSHGFMFRYKSSARVPSWVNEGVADWVAAAVVRSCDETRRRQRSGAEQARQQGNLGGNFFGEANIDAWQYGVASALVDLMLKEGPKYRQFIEQIKEGLPWEDALQKTFGLTPVGLVSAYGATIGAPGLRP